MAALSLLLIAPPARADATSTPAPLVDVPGYEALTSSFIARGDYEAAARQLVAVAARDPRAEAAELALMKLEALTRTAPHLLPLIRDLEGSAPTPPRAARSRDRALRLQARLLKQEGALEGAAAKEAARGHVRSLWLIGPFGFTRDALHDRAFGPERDRVRPDLGARHEGRYGEVSWQPWTMGPLEDDVRPGVRYRLDDGAVYALARFRAPEGTGLRVTVEAPGSFRVWWNGEEALDVDRAEAFLPDAIDVVAEVDAGWQRLLVKVSQPGRGFSLRIVRADGSGLPDGLEVATIEAPRHLEPAGHATLLGEERPPLPDDARALARYAYGFRLADEGLVPDALEALDRAAASGAPLPLLHLDRMRLLENASHLPPAERTPRAKEALEAALAVDPDLVPARLNRELYRAKEGQPIEALKALLAIQAAHPKARDALIAARSVAREQGFDEEALDLTRALAALEPREAGHEGALAQAADRRGDTRAERRHLERAAALDAWGYARRVAELDARTGAPDRALSVYLASFDAMPNDPSLLRRMSSIAAMVGRLDEAIAYALAAAEAAGRNPRDLEQAAELRELLLAGWTDASGPEAARAEVVAERLAGYEAVVAEAPGSFHLARYVAGLRAGKTAVEAARATFAPAYADLWIQDGAELPAGAFPKAGSVALLDHTITEVHADGSYTDTVHQIFLIRDANGIERYHTIAVPGEVLLLRTIAKDGTVHEPLVTNQGQVLMPSLEPGARIERAYRVIREAPPTFQLELGPFYLQDPELKEPFAHTRWDVLVPRGLDLAVTERNLRTEGTRTMLDDGRIHYVWEDRMAEGLEPEPSMPTRDEVVPHVALLTRRGWADVGEVLWERYRGRFRLTPALVRAAKEQAGDAGSEAEVARRLARFVQEHVVRPQGGLEASEVLASRGGRRIVLLKALLDAAGIRSRIAVVTPNPDAAPPIVWDPPRPDIFQAELLFIEPKDGEGVFWFDEGRYAPYDRIPFILSGGTALLLSEDGFDFAPLPTVPERETRIEETLSVTLLAGGGARIASRVFDPTAHQAKETLARVPKDRLRLFAEGQAAQRFFRPKVTEVVTDGLDDPDAPLVFGFDAELPEHVREADGERTIPLGITPLGLGRRLGQSGAERKHPLVMRSLVNQESRVRIDLGPYRVAALPADTLIRGAIGLYALTYREQGGALVITRRLHIAPHVLPATAYPRLIEEAQAIDAAERQRITVVPAE